MRSLFDFIIKPYGKRYNNTVNVDKKELIINAGIEDHKFINRIGEVVETPLNFKSPIKKGDLVIVHFNLFRRWYDIRGVEKNSSRYFKENLYFCEPTQIYMYKNKSKWVPNMNYCFVKPVLKKQNLSGEKLQQLRGILKYGNSSLEALEINTGDTVGFKKNSEYEFVIDNELLYCMKSNDIIIKYEHDKNQVEYNPSWAQSC
tara:strand:- start:12386 stop:12991 length:606 start_codon:yes stop_codon:yes gene_type:complete